MFNMGVFSLLPVWPGSAAELPRDRLPLLISFSQGVLLTGAADRTGDDTTADPDPNQDQDQSWF